MKYYKLNRHEYNFCDIFTHPLGYFKHEDLAIYLQDEFNKAFGRRSWDEDTTWFSVEEIEIIEGQLENWQEIYEKLKKGAE